MHVLFSFLQKGKQKIASLSVSPSPPPLLCRTCCVLAFCIVSFYLPHLAEMIVDISHINVFQILGFRVLVNYRTHVKFHTIPKNKKKKIIIHL